MFLSVSMVTGSTGTDPAQISSTHHLQLSEQWSRTIPLSHGCGLHHRTREEWIFREEEANGQYALDHMLP